MTRATRLLIVLLGALFIFTVLASAQELMLDDDASSLFSSPSDALMEEEDEVETLQNNAQTITAQQQQQQQPEKQARFIFELSYLLIAAALAAIVIVIFVVQACIPQPIGEQLAAEIAAKPKVKLTVDQAVEYLGYDRFQHLLLLFCGVAMVASAGEVMMTSFLMPELRATWGAEGWQTALMGAMIFLGQLLGSMTWGIVGDYIGRKWACFIIMISTSAFGFASAFSPNIYVMIVFRFFVGVGIGGDVVVFALFTEYLPVAYRGNALMNLQTFWSVGTVGMSLIAMIFLPKEASRLAFFGTDAWRYMLVTVAIPYLLIIPFVYLLPESPRFLMVTGRVEEAQKTFERVAYFNEKPVNFELVAPVKSTVSVAAQEAPSSSSSARGRVWHLFSRRYWLITISTQFIWAFGGLTYYGISFLTPVFFQYKSSGIYDQYISVLIVSLAELPGQFVGNFTINNIGRKLTLFFFYLMAGISIMMLLIPFHYIGLTIVACVARAAINGATSMNWVMTSEMYPTVLRTTALGYHSCYSKITGSAAPWITNLLFTKTNNLPAIIIFGIVCIIASGLSCCLPETAGKKLNDFQHDEINEEELMLQDEQFEVSVEEEAAKNTTGNGNNVALKKDENEIKAMNEPFLAATNATQ